TSGRVTVARTGRPRWEAQNCRSSSTRRRMIHAARLDPARRKTKIRAAKNASPPDGRPAMPLTVHQFACLSDNYGFLARDEATGQTACIDTPDAGAILRELDKLGWKLDFIFNTHWHPDHAGGNAEIQAATGCTIVGPKEVTRIAPLDREVGDGDEVKL